MAYIPKIFVNDSAPAISAEYLNGVENELSSLDENVNDSVYKNEYTEENPLTGYYIDDFGNQQKNDNALTTDYIEVPTTTDCTFIYSTLAVNTQWVMRINGYDSGKGWVKLLAKEIIPANTVHDYSMSFSSGNNIKYIRISINYRLYCNPKLLVFNSIGEISANDKVLRNDIMNNIKFNPDQMSFFAPQSKNLINPANIDNNIRPRESDVKLIARAGNFSGSGFIEVVEGETYTISGTAFTVYQGIYFGANAKWEVGQTGIGTATFFDAVDYSGKCFTVPENQGIKYVALNLADTGVLVDGVYPIAGTYQMEKGEVATQIVPYDGTLYIEPQYIKDSGGGGGETEIDGLDLLPRPQYNIDKISNFKEHWLKKDKDLVVCNTGTSLTARSLEHCTMRLDASYRPPLLHSYNLASYIWDALAWDEQQYRRYDVEDFFTEVGAFSTVSSDANWDEGSYRAGLTRMATGSASVSFEVPEDAWQFNFIYRTDTLGCQNVSVSVAEGNNKMEVFDGSSWVEANGFSFSMRQSTVVLPSVTVPKPNSTSGETSTMTDYQVGGNTTYQKRLKMRCKSGSINSIGTTKTVTISSASDRFMYWGVEWSPRQYMITFINAARGSHNITYNSQYALMHYQDNEIWSFNPDLMLTENPIHNSGAGEAPGSTYHTTYWGNITYDFFFNEDDPISLVSRATANGLNVADIEWVIFNTSVSWNFGPINDAGDLKVAINADGFAMSSMDEQMYSNLALVAEDKAVVINAIKYWVNSAYKLYGDLKTATQGSGKNGKTLTNEGSHWNDRGCKLMAKCICPVVDFYDD